MLDHIEGIFPLRICTSRDLITKKSSWLDYPWVEIGVMFKQS